MSEQTMKIRRLMLEKAYTSKTGHIGSNLSICDMVWCLYDKILNVKPVDFEDMKNQDRDRFILSKGHAGLSLYVSLFLKGFISKDELDSYCDHHGTNFPAHPKHYIKGVEYSSGSLGQGITFAVGEALAAKIQKSDRKVYCLISDGEINEGSCWEAFMFATHHKLSNLCVLYDNNDLQALGKPSEVIENSNIEEKMTAFGFNVKPIDGHNLDEIRSTVLSAINNSKKPIFINAKTISGKGVSFMEDGLKWHYKSMSENEYNLALSELI